MTESRQAGDGLGETTDGGSRDVRPGKISPVAERYVLLDPLGRGGSADVHTAFDRKLDRKIAIKLIRDPAAQGRVLREAQALARIRHPNVVTVFDAGTLDDRVFLTMELVEGQSLRVWLDETPRPWREILAVFLAAGRGLAAVHAAGLVHRDFKPDNVLVGKDGGVRVADFGLVRVADESVPAGEPTSPLALELTATGGIVGTPRYMPPEQHEGAIVDARGDQFSYCAALYSALYRQAPFAGETLEELRENVTAGRLREPAAGRKVPHWLAAAVRRGLARAPADRWPSMDVLLDELGRDRGKPVRRVLLAAALAAVAGAMILAFTRQPGPPACAGAAARLAGVWDPARREAVNQAFHATGLGYAGDAFQSVAASLDGYTSVWAAMRDEACQATAVRHEQSEALLDLRMRCLDRKLEVVHGLVAVLAQGPDPKILDRAVAAATRLAPLSECADQDALESAAPLPADPATRTAIATALAGLAHVTALENLGKKLDDLREAEALALAVRFIQYPPLSSDVLSALARARTNFEAGAVGQQAFLEALPAAARAHDDRAVATIYIALLRNIGLIQSRPDEALVLRPFAEAAVARAGDPPALRARLLHNVGVVLREKSDFAASLAVLEEAHAMAEAGHDPDGVFMGDLQTDIGVSMAYQGDIEGARAHFEQALALYQATLGPRHPRVAGAKINLALFLVHLGKLNDARAMLASAVEIAEASEGPDGPEVALALENLGGVDRMLGDYEQARAVLDKDVALQLRLHPPTHPQVAGALELRAEAFLGLGLLVESEADSRQALAIYETTRGPVHPDVADALRPLARAVLARGKPADGLPLSERALTVDEKTQGPGHPNVALDLGLRAEALAALGKTAEAVESVERAVAIFEKTDPDGLGMAASLTVLAEARLTLGHGDALGPARRALAIKGKAGVSPELLAPTRFALARAMWNAGTDKPGALALARQARADYATAASRHAKDLTDIDAWVARH